MAFCVLCSSILLILIYCSSASAQTFDQTALEAKLFDKYNRKVRPVRNALEKLEVSFAVHIRHIESVDEVQQTLQFHGTIFMSWVDANLQWSPSDYNYTWSINVSPWKVWMPDIALFNTASGTEFTFNYWKYPVWITSNGQIAGWQDFSFSVTCKFDFYNFPKDSQTCFASMGSWMYDYSEVDWKWIEQLMVKAKLSWYGEGDKRHSNGWELVNATGHKAFWGPTGVIDAVPDDLSPKFLWPMMLIRMEIKRHRPYFYVTEVLPLVLIGLLTLSSFWVESELVTLTILLVNLLSQGVLSWGLLNQLPPASGALPKVVVIYGLNFGLTFTALFVHIVLHCLNASNVELPSYVGNLTDRADQFKPLNIRGVSFSNWGDDHDDQERIVDQDEEGQDKSKVITVANVGALPKLLFIVRRIVFFIYLFVYLSLFVVMLA